MRERKKLQNEFRQLFSQTQRNSRKDSIDTIQQIFQESLEASKKEGLGFDATNIDFQKIQDDLLQASSPHQYVIDELCKDIESGIQNSDYVNSMHFYVGEAPTGEINAFAMPSETVKNGALILINFGLMQLIYQTLKVMMFTMNFLNKDGELDCPYFEESKSEEKQSTKQLAKIFEAYVKYGDITIAPRYSTLGGYEGLLQAHTVGAAEKFVIGHEYGHGILGHLDNLQSIRTMTPMGELQILDETNQNEEYDADSVGLDILNRTKVNLDDDPVLNLIQFFAMDTGPLFFFNLLELDSQIHSEVLRVDFDESTHPPNYLRAKKLRNLIKNNTMKNSLQFADNCSEWISSKQDDIISHLKKEIN